MFSSDRIIVRPNLNPSWEFLSRVSTATLTRDIDIRTLSLRSSVRLFVTFRYYIETAWRHHAGVSSRSSLIV